MEVQIGMIKAWEGLMGLHPTLRIYMPIMGSAEGEDIFFSGVAIREVYVPVNSFHHTPVNNLTELKKKKKRH